MTGRRRLDPVANWWSKVDARGPDECWPWLAGVDRCGYGKFAIGLGGHAQIHTRAHRFGYLILIGPITPDLVVCHTCDNPPCCNPAHWFAGTPKDNNDDKLAKGRGVVPWGSPLTNMRKTHCKRGHEFTPENTRTSKDGYRSCKTCGNAAALRHYYRRTA